MNLGFAKLPISLIYTCTGYINIMAQFKFLNRSGWESPNNIRSEILQRSVGDGKTSLHRTSW